MDNLPAEDSQLEFSEDLQPIFEKSTACDHYYIQDPDQDPNTNMVSVRCIQDGCWSGASYDPQYMDLKDGEIRRK